MRLTWMRLCCITIGLVFAVPARGEPPRVIVLTDISNEPDDEESLVRYLVYANQFKTEGLIATTSTWLRSGVREDLIRRQLDAYEKVQPSLSVHEAGFPTANALRAVVRSGQDAYGMAAVGDGRATPGSALLLETLIAPDDQPVWVLLWGGANTLAQALWDLRQRAPAAERATALARLRVYSISDQDDAGAWIRQQFPDVFYIVSPSTQDSEEYWRATWTGISGDRFYRNGPGHAEALVESSWLREHVIEGHGPLGALYPKPVYIMEGDTPSFLGLIDHGLGWTESPDYGGWGGRYVLYRATGETRPIWTNNARSRDTVTADNGETDTSDPATVWRWRKHFQHDFAARMDWCVASRYTDANHPPRVVLNGRAGRDVVRIRAAPGETVALSSAGSSDPDGDELVVTWWIYPEVTQVPGCSLSGGAGEATGLQIPADASPGEIHVILQVEDRGQPSLFAYRRAIIAVETRK